MIISFSWTTPALRSGIKTATSRQWKESYLAQWQRAYDRGDRRHQAWDKSPRSGGSQVGWVTLTDRPRRKLLRDFTEEEVRAEAVGCNTVEEWLEWVQDFPLGAEVVLLRFSFDPLPDPQESLGP